MKTFKIRFLRTRVDEYEMKIEADNLNDAVNRGEKITKEYLVASDVKVSDKVAVLSVK